MAISVAGGLKTGKIVDVEKRLYQQLIVGKQKSNAMFDELDAELEASASKLDIEREAILARLQKQIDAKAIYEAISTQLTDTVCNAIEHQLSQPELVLKSATVDQAQLMLLEILQAKNLDLNRLRPMIAGQSWIAKDLLTMVNSPAFRAKRPQRADVKVTDIKLVLNFVGIESLKTIIPYYCLRHWLPSGHASLLWTKRKLWRYSVVSAIAVKALANLHRRNECLLYCVSLLSQLGTSVILGNSARLFEKTWGTWLREASGSRDKEVYDAIIATEFPAQAVLEQVLNRGSELNWQLLNLLDFKDSKLSSLLTEIDQTMVFRELSEDAKLIAKASCYAKVMLLEEMRQIEPQEKRVMFDYYEFTEQELIRLKGQNYRKLELL